MIGIVYKIEIGEKIYIGSTIQTIRERESKHNNRLKQNFRTNKLYEECRKKNIDKIICIPLETKEIENDLEIRELEQEYITKLQPLLNECSAYTGLKPEEYNRNKYQINKTALLEKQKQYYINNKDERKEYYKQYRKKYVEKIKEQKKEYCENNKERIKENKKKYYQNNKEELNDKKKVDITCPICGFVGRKDKLNRHQQTKKCLKSKEFMNQI